MKDIINYPPYKWTYPLLTPKEKARFNFIDSELLSLSKEEKINILNALLNKYSRSPNYEEAYNILMNYFDFIPEEERHEVDKKLKRCGV